jgi:hypothetical protein
MAEQHQSEGEPAGPSARLVAAIAKNDADLAALTKIMHEAADGLDKFAVPGPPEWRPALESLRRRTRALDSALTRLLKRVNDPD